MKFCSVFPALLFLPTIAAAAAALATDGSQSDVQAKINSAIDGDTVTLPAGSFTWSSGVTIAGKGIHLRGAGGSRIVARSRTSRTVGTGAHTFALLSARANTPLASYLDLGPGDAIRIHRTGGSNSTAAGSPVWMLGTVTSYSAGSLVANITSVSATGGEHDIWIVEKVGATRIINNAGSSSPVSITEDASHSVEVSALSIDYGTGTGASISISGTSGGKPVLIHDLGFYNTFPGSDDIYSNVSRGVIWNCSFWATVWSSGPLPVHLKGGDPSSWTTVSTMGAADTTGTGNVYVEDCDFHAYLNGGDIDDNMRAVVRNSLFNNAGFGSHGQESSAHGVRHFEFYNNEFIFDTFVFNPSDVRTFNLAWLLLIRGGTGVITANVMPNINSTDYGDKAEILLQIQNLNRNQWGAGKYTITSAATGSPTIITTSAPHTGQTGQKVYITGSNSTPSLDGSHTMTRLSSTTFSVPVNVTVAGTAGFANPANWPANRQVGRGYVTGAGVSGMGGSTFLDTYVGDSEPLYIWGNSGTSAVGIDDGAGGFGVVDDPDLGADYIIDGRDYYVDGTAKPSYTSYTYPHPLRTALAAVPSFKLLGSGGVIGRRR